MKSHGYTEKELSEVFAFQSFRSEHEVLLRCCVNSDLCYGLLSVVCVHF